MPKKGANLGASSLSAILSVPYTIQVVCNDIVLGWEHVLGVNCRLLLLVVP